MAELAFDLKQAMAHLAAVDVRLAALMARAPTFELKAEPDCARSAVAASL